jgi:peptidyl-prolyl cis-trans isomerase B (cyclophilin B)
VATPPTANGSVAGQTNEAAIPVTPQSPGTRKVKIKTTFGDMVVLLYDATPLHRDNFIKLASENYFDGLLFHRCIKGFMAQGGDPQSKNYTGQQPLGGGGPGYTLPAEFKPELVHKKGTLAGARMRDEENPEKRSNGSQFYIVQGTVQNELSMQQAISYQAKTHPDKTYSAQQIEAYKKIGGYPPLDWEYTVFGEIISGLEVLDLILAQPTKQGGMTNNQPLTPIVMDIDVIE